ncbi:MAG: hypothetical protein ACO2ON_01925 [Candidatus Nanopusillus sp.]
MGIIDRIREMKEIYETANKPSWDEVKKMVYVTLLFFALVAAIALPIFISLQYSIMICQYMP